MMLDFPGTYLLILRSELSEDVVVGRCGILCVQPGYYLYAGSAFGPGGLRGRLAHHYRQAATPRWHVDYLRRICSIAGVWYAPGPEKLEHAWALALAGMPQLTIPVTRFGASDCRCPAHLFYSQENPLQTGQIDLTKLPSCHTGSLLIGCTGMHHSSGV